MPWPMWSSARNVTCRRAIEPGEDRARLLSYAEAALERLGLARSGRREITTGSCAGRGHGCRSRLERRAPGRKSPEGSPRLHEAVGQAPVDQAQPSSEPTDDTGMSRRSIPRSSRSLAKRQRKNWSLYRAVTPSGATNRDDSESLQTMRRSFHTLKGSGRIVGASNIGEFSWSVENLLNRVIDGTVQRVAGRHPVDG